MKAFLPLLTCSLLSAFALAQQEIVPPSLEQPASGFRVLDSQEMVLENRSIIYNRVVPPAFASSSPVQSTGTELITEISAENEVQRPEKKSEVLFLSAAVHNHGITELRWFEEGTERSAFSNIDFNYFSGLGEFETDDTVYTLLLAVWNEPAKSAELKSRIPGQDRFSPTRSEYFLSDHRPETSITSQVLASLDALHVYFDANKAALVKDHAKWEAERAERERWLRDNPPTPKDTIIHFWPEKGSRYLRSDDKARRITK